jgi:hypothetical protein
LAHKGALKTVVEYAAGDSKGGCYSEKTDVVISWATKVALDTFIENYSIKKLKSQVKPKFLVLTSPDGREKLKDIQNLSKPYIKRL